MNKEIAKVHQTAHHRNGVGGAPFGLVLFKPDQEYGNRTFLGIVFGEKGYTAVLDVDLLTSGVIEFGANSWRGDNFEPELIEALAATGRSPYPDPEVEREFEVTVEVVRPVDFKADVVAKSHADAEEKALELLYQDLGGDAGSIEVVDIDVQEV